MREYRGLRTQTRSSQRPPADAVSVGHAGRSWRRARAPVEPGVARVLNLTSDRCVAWRAGLGVRQR